jgi:hypothetical protein
MIARGFECIQPNSRAFSTPAENGIFEPFTYKNEHFAKTGSGQT